MTEPTTDPAELRAICEREIEAARQLKADPMSYQAAREWADSHGARVKATHPTNMLTLLDHIEELEGALRGIANRTTQYGDRMTYPIHLIAVAALAQPRVDGPETLEQKCLHGRTVNEYCGQCRADEVDEDGPTETPRVTEEMVKDGADELGAALALFPDGESPVTAYTPEGFLIWLRAVVRTILAAALGLTETEVSDG